MWDFKASWWETSESSFSGGVWQGPHLAWLTVPSGLETGRWTSSAALKVPDSPGFWEEVPPVLLRTSIPGVSTPGKASDWTEFSKKAPPHQVPCTLTSPASLPPSPCFSPVSSLTRSKLLTSAKYVCALGMLKTRSGCSSSALGKLPLLGENKHQKRQVKLPPYQGSVRAGKPNWVRDRGQQEPF